MSENSTASERSIEDILAQSPSILASIIDVEANELIPVARQQSLPSGRTDLVYLAGNDIILIELKVVKATEDHVNQLSAYVHDCQNKGTEPAFAKDRNLRPILLAPQIPSDVRSSCTDSDLEPITYELSHVLEEYQETLFADLAHFQVKGVVTSVAGLSLINRYLEFLASRQGPVTVSEAAVEYDYIGKGSSNNPESRVRNFRKAGKGLELVQTTQEGMILTERGEEYVAGGDYENQPWNVTADQADTLIDLLYEKPFHSDLTYSLVALLESVFELSKNSHPVPRDQVEDWYASKVGKRDSWGERTRTDVVRWLSTYLDELGLLSRVDRQFYITPEGFQLISYVMIDKGKAMIRSQ
ncbi:PDDEXK family nuclease [Natronolimnobius baerhuensis]|nr:endonuclease NucS domain-containing protein [Natronolimnobius baerhuensis]